MTKNKVGCFNIGLWLSRAILLKWPPISSLKLSGGDVLFFGGPTCFKRSTFHPSQQISFIFNLESKSRLPDGPLLCSFALVTLSCRSDLRVYLKRYLKWHMLDCSKVSNKVEQTCRSAARKFLLFMQTILRPFQTF